MQNPFSLSGKVALVTGGNGGIGRSIALGFANAGAWVAVTGRNSDKNGTMAQELGDQGRVYELDVRDKVQVEHVIGQIVADFGRLDILVNNAGIARRKALPDTTEQDWHDVLDTHLTGAFLCAQAGAKPMIAQGEGGKIINIGSMYSIFGPPNIASYAAAKTGMVGLTRALAVELGEHKIQVNAILPGWHKTDLNRAILDGPLGDQVRHKTPARRLGTPDDLAGAAVFLASSAADFVNGAALVVDGGYSIMDRRWDE